MVVGLVHVIKKDSMKKYLLMLIAPMVLISCEEPLSKSKTNNAEYTIEYLFKHDGCKVFKFRDYGSKVYFTKCGSTQYEERCGKSCHRDVQVIKGE